MKSSFFKQLQMNSAFDERSEKGNTHSQSDLRKLVLNKSMKFSYLQDEPQQDQQFPSRTVNSTMMKQARNQERQRIIKKILSSKEIIDLSSEDHCQIMLEVLAKAIKNKEEISFIQHFLSCSSALEFSLNGNFQINDMPSQIYPFVDYSFTKKGTILYSQGEVAQNYYVLIKGSVGQKCEEDEQEEDQNKEQPKKSPQNFLKQCSMNDALLRSTSKTYESSEETESQINTYPSNSYEKIYKQGQSFGDNEIITNQLRASTTACLEDCHLLTISKEGFEVVLVKYRKFQVQEKIGFFQQFPFFQDIHPTRLLTLINLGSTNTYSNHQVIYQEGEKVEYIHFVKSGEVSLSQIKEKRRLTLSIISVNSYFGQDEIVNLDSIRQHRAKSNCNGLSLVSFPMTKFLKLLTQFKLLDQFMADAQAKTSFRSQCGDKIISIQTQISADQGYLFKQKAEEEKQIRKTLSMRMGNSSTINREKEVQELIKLDRVGEIVNAREEVFTLIKQQAPLKRNMSFQSSINLDTQKDRDSKIIFDEGLIFNQAYYQDQEPLKGFHYHNLNNSQQQLQKMLKSEISNSKTTISLSGTSSELQNIDSSPSISRKLNNNQSFLSSQVHKQIEREILPQKQQNEQQLQQKIIIEESKLRKQQSTFNFKNLDNNIKKNSINQQQQSQQIAMEEHKLSQQFNQKNSNKEDIEIKRHSMNLNPKILRNRNSFTPISLKERSQSEESKEINLQQNPFCQQKQMTFQKTAIHFRKQEFLNDWKELKKQQCLFISSFHNIKNEELVNDKSWQSTTLPSKNGGKCQNQISSYFRPRGGIKVPKKMLGNYLENCFPSNFKTEENCKNLVSSDLINIEPMHKSDFITSPSSLKFSYAISTTIHRLPCSVQQKLNLNKFERIREKQISCSIDNYASPIQNDPTIKGSLFQIKKLVPQTASDGTI